MSSEDSILDYDDLAAGDDFGEVDYDEVVEDSQLDFQKGNKEDYEEAVVSEYYFPEEGFIVDSSELAHPKVPKETDREIIVQESVENLDPDPKEPKGTYRIEKVGRANAGKKGNEIEVVIGFGGAEIAKKTGRKTKLVRVLPLSQLEEIERRKNAFGPIPKDKEPRKRGGKKKGKRGKTVIDPSSIEKEVFGEGEKVLVRLKETGVAVGSLAMVDGKFHILTKTKEMKVVKAKNIKQLERGIVEGEIKLNYDSVSFFPAVILKPAGKDEYKVQISEGEHAKEILKVKGKDIIKNRRGFILVDSVIDSLRRYLRRNFMELIESYKPGHVEKFVKEKKETWKRYWDVQFTAWHRSIRYGEAAKKIDEDAVEKLVIENTPEEILGEVDESRREYLINRYKKQVVNDLIQEQLDRSPPTEGEIIYFQEHFGDELKKLYEQQPEEVIDERFVSADIKKSVHIYEKEMYEKYGNDVAEYISQFLYPYVFLSKLSPFTRHALFLQEKIKSEEFKVEDLSSVSLAYLIPELFIGREVLRKPDRFAPKDDVLIDEIFGIISKSLNNITRYITSSYIATLDPTARVTTQQFSIVTLPAELEDMFTKVSDLCGELKIRDAKICLKKGVFTCELIK